MIMILGPATNAGAAQKKREEREAIAVVEAYAGLPLQTDVAIGYALGVPQAESYTVIVDYDRRIAGTNDGNNRCTRSSTGDYR
jgi:hypothetical protein